MPPSPVAARLIGLRVVCHALAISALLVAVPASQTLRAQAPDPRGQPSGVLLTGRSPTGTDLYDRAALQDAAAYADVLVTTDDQLTKLAARTALPIRVLDYRTWNDELRAR